MTQLTTPETTTPTRRGVSAARVCSIVGFVFAAIAVLFFPIVFGLVAVILGVVAGALGDRPMGWYAAAAGVAGGVIGVLLTAALLNS
ncbi:hypothetical protein Val02_12180 [Virgisporangium aliadipatigenens]|uniref:DUF4190 domain-containing protein n=1 Tax=Virgisporangium aliadipatigenens TaxID=741659 RepID=A0A8J3YHG0_9ACTN|nr:hypothetical protein [Virgisporangium aliadipatigenens]GIJ44332.1 hypothetical protein Val02_12180 [Virgisporangium aliadipatigenens]